MSDHVWTQEHVAAHLAGGLTALEAERLEAHARECPLCADALAAARRFESGLSALFADARPGPELEDRTIARFRAGPPRKRSVGRWGVRVAAAVAAVLLLGTVGALAGSVVNGGIPMPGHAKRKLAAPQSPLARARGVHGRPPEENLIQEDLGLDANFDSVIPEIERVAEQTVEAAVTRDNIGQPDAPNTHNLALAAPGLATDTFTNAGVAGVGGDVLWGDGGGGSFAASFQGRSGATKSQLLGRGGGESSGNHYGYNSFGRMYATSDGTATNVPTSGSGKTSGNTPVRYFVPSDYYAVTGVNGREPVQKQVTVMERVPVQKTVTVMERGGPVQKTVPVTETRAVVVVPSLGQKEPPKGAEPAPVNPEPARRVILRSGDIEFEVPTFDAASATVSKLIDARKGAFISTVNSEKLPNGKVKGSITVRIPPDLLDAFVADLKKELGTTGELKGVKLTSSDVTKQYYDLESRLRAARTMETRLLQIIKEGKGEIKLLLEAEKELGVWRTKIEEFEGELRYFSNLATLSTLVVNLTEKEIRVAAGQIEKERVQAGVEVEDVDSAYQQLLKAIIDAKGRISKSELKQLSAGQYNATINFEVAPEAGGPMRDRLRQLGRVARFEIDRVREAEGGTLPTDAKLKYGDTAFLVQLYNLVNVAPRETATLQVAVVDVPAAYQALREAVAKTTGRVLHAQLNEQDRRDVAAQFDYEVRRPDEGAVRAVIDAAGEVTSRQVTRAPEGENVTDAKVQYRVTLISAASLKPREVVTVGVEVEDVEQASAAIAKYADDAKGRHVDSRFGREPSGKVTAKLVFDVPLTAVSGLVDRFKSVGALRTFNTTKNPQASDGKFAKARVEVTVTNRDAIIPDDDGLSQQVRNGLSFSVSWLLKSVMWLVVGLCVVLPWVPIAFALYRVVRRWMRGTTVTVPTAA